MRPANQQQAVRHMEYLLKRRIKGSRKTCVKERIDRAKRIAIAIWGRFQVGPYQYKLKHLRWYMDVCIIDLAPSTRYRHWLAIKDIVYALDKKTALSVLVQGERFGVSR